MTTLREAAQQALEALEGGADSWQRVGPAIDALKAALAEPKQDGCDHCNHPMYAAIKCRVCGRVTEPVQEPYAWMSVGGSIWRHKTTEDDVPLYTAPRKPLTEEEIKACEKQAMVNGSLPFEQRVFFARAIERAHNIKE